jgi:hypothetical protein
MRKTSSSSIAFLQLLLTDPPLIYTNLYSLTTHAEFSSDVTQLNFRNFIQVEHP